MQTRSLVRHTFALAALAALATTNARAQGFYATDATINYAVNGDAVVGYGTFNDYLTSTNPASPTVSLVSGGSVSGDLDVLNNSRVSVSGGSVSGSLFTYNTSVVSVSGGSIDGLTAFESSVVTISGGSIGGNLNAANSGTLNFFGSLTDTLVVSFPSGFSEYALYGTLADGTPLNGRLISVQDGTGAKFTLNPAAVPEPGSVALLTGLTMTAAGFLRRRKTRA